MAAPESFTLLSALPLELQRKIWIEALSERSVWAAVRKTDANRPRFVMTHVGPAPYQAGLACAESRRLMERLYREPLRGPRSSTSSAAYWVNLDTTVIYLGNACDTMDIMDAFSADEVSRWRHVALDWSQFGNLARVCLRLATACPKLRTIITRRELSDSTSENPGTPFLRPDLAAYYASIPDLTGPELSDDTLDAAYFRGLLLEYFGDSLPRIHLVASGFESYPG